MQSFNNIYELFMSLHLASTCSLSMIYQGLVYENAFKGKDTRLVITRNKYELKNWLGNDHWRAVGIVNNIVGNDSLWSIVVFEKEVISH